MSAGGYGYGSNDDLVASPTTLILAPTEAWDCSFDFSTLPLLTGEYITSILSTTYSPNDDATVVPARTLISNVAIGPGATPTTVKFRVTQPADKVDYLVTIVVETSFTGTSGASETRAGVFWVLGRAAYDRIRNLTAIYREGKLSFDTNRVIPEVGDEITIGPGQGPPREQNLDQRMWLAVKIGPDKISKSYPRGQQGELWLAWNEQTGTLSTVSVGYFWILREKDENQS